MEGQHEQSGVKRRKMRMKRAYSFLNNKFFFIRCAGPSGPAELEHGHWVGGFAQLRCFIEKHLFPILQCTDFESTHQ